jgi:hypothetical protein
MKKNNLITLIIATFFVLTSCKDKNIEVKPENNEEIARNAQAKIEKKLIDSKFALELNNNYIKERSELILKYTGKEDANAIWYPIEDLENYIRYAKLEGKKQGLKINGIRFYLGVYPNTKEYLEKAGMTTIFLTPTMPKDKNRQQMQKFVGAVIQSTEKNADVTSVKPMNYGNMGTPPSLEYGQQ